MVAVKSLAVAFGLASVSVAIGPLKRAPSVAVIALAVRLKPASATAAVPVAVVAAPPSSEALRTNAYLVSSLKAWLPLTLNPPVGLAGTVPGEAWPSPQSMVTVKSLAVAFGLASASEAIGPLNSPPSVAVMAIGVSARAASVTQAVAD